MIPAIIYGLKKQKEFRLNILKVLKNENNEYSKQSINNQISLIPKYFSGKKGVMKCYNDYQNSVSKNNNSSLLEEEENITNLINEIKKVMR